LLNVIDAEKPFLRRWFKVKEHSPSKQEIRRSVILQIVKNLGPTPGHVPSVREMQEHLRKRGLTVDHTTVLRDYEALGLNYTEMLFPDVEGTENGDSFVIAKQNATHWTTHLSQSQDSSCPSRG
jgi:hypothetical protein